jgi:chromobox protein 5
MSNYRSNQAEDVYVVEEILARKYSGGQHYYKIRWKGYSPSDDTWEPEKNIIDEALVSVSTSTHYHPSNTW